MAKKSYQKMLRRTLRRRPRVAPASKASGLQHVLCLFAVQERICRKAICIRARSRTTGQQLKRQRRCSSAEAQIAESGVRRIRAQVMSENIYRKSQILVSESSVRLNQNSDAREVTRALSRPHGRRSRAAGVCVPGGSQGVYARVAATRAARPCGVTVTVRTGRSQRHAH